MKISITCHIMRWLKMSALILSVVCMGDGPVRATPSLEIALLVDGHRTESLFSLFESEITALLGSKYRITLTLQDGQWSVETIETAYRGLVSDPDVDLIVGAGPITGSVIAKQRPYAKPVIAVGIIDPEVQGLPWAVDNQSRIPNLTYILAPRSIVQDLAAFYEVFPYERLGFVYFKELIKTVSPGGQAQIDRFLENQGANLVHIPVDRDIDAVFQYLDRVDALYISYLGRFEGEAKKALVRQLNRAKMPTFGALISDARDGMLAAMAPADIQWKLIRRICLNIEAWADGRNLSELPVSTEYEKQLTINMKTAADIGISPRFKVLAGAELLHETYVRADRTVDLTGVMAEALEKNLDLALSDLDVRDADEAVESARTAFYPSFSAGVDGVVIDEETAEKAGGSMARTTFSGNLSATQRLYDNEASAAIRSRDVERDAAGLTRESVRLDVVLDAVEAYFSILKAKTTRKIYKDNVNLIRRNLKTAQQREIVGHSGRSDVLRWKSELAAARTDLLASQQDVILAKNELNRILDRPQEETFQVSDASLDDEVFKRYAANGVESYIDNQNGLDRFTRFYAGRCVENSFEIQALDRERTSHSLTLDALKQKNYLPTVRFSANATHVVSRHGTGSDVPGIDPVDNPWDAGVYLDLPFYDSGTIRVEIRQALLAISRIEIRKRALANQIETNARHALSDVMVKMVNLTSSREAARHARENLTLVQDAYAKGTVTVVELADAQNNSLEAELDAISSTYDYLVSLFRLERLYGHYSLLLPPDSPDRILHQFITSQPGPVSGPASLRKTDP